MRPSPSQAHSSPQQVLHEQQIPVFIVHGADDLIVPPANSRRLAAQLPGATLAMWPGVGHMPQEEAPQRFVDEVAAFLEATLGCGASCCGRSAAC